MLFAGIRSPLSDIKQEHRPAPEHSKQQLERVPGEAGEETVAAAAAAAAVSIPPSPPLELRHPGVAPRASHSLQSPSDRATDSPQVSQVYMHGARIGHQYTPRYYESPPTNTPSVVARIRPQQRPSEQFPTPNQTCQLPILVDSLLELLQVIWGFSFKNRIGHPDESICYQTLYIVRHKNCFYWRFRFIGRLLS